MVAETPSVGSRQGIKAFPKTVQFGSSTLTFDEGTPSATFVALRIGDVYIDNTNGAVYIASATGSGSWVALAALSSMASGATIGGATFQTQAGTPIGVTTATRIGDVAIDYTNGQWYVANATGTAGWMLVGGGQSSSRQTYSAVIALATLQAGATVLPAVAGMSYTILGFKVSTATGTPAGTGNFILSNAAGTQVALTASVAQLASATSAAAAITDSTYTLATVGAYTGVKMTQGVAVKFAAMASLTGPYTMQIQIDFILTV